MNYLKRSATLLFGAVISVSSINGVVLAQSAEKYHNVGLDSSGDPYLLDTTTMGKRERGYGNVLKVYQIKDSLMTELLIKASCGDNRLWIVGMRTYNENGIKLAEDKRSQEVQLQAGSPATESIRYYCRSIGARGW